jgi:hypothetical protein
MWSQNSYVGSLDVRSPTCENKRVSNGEHPMPRLVTHNISLATPSGSSFYSVTASVDGSDVSNVDVAATDMSFRSRLARASYEQHLRAHLAELGRDWSEVEAALVAKAAKASKLAALEAELEHLQGDYADSDRQDAELRAAIRKQKKLIKSVKEAA